MTEAKFKEMSFEEFLDWAHENINDLTTEDILIDFAKSKN